jgi:hypothetical protein
MNIRELMNMLEAIEQKPEGDEKPADKKDEKHHAKHGQKHGDDAAVHHKKHGEKHDQNKEEDDKDLEQDDGDDEEDDDSKKIGDLKDVAGSIGKDLYTITVFDYTRDFVDANANRAMLDVLKKFDSSSIDQFIDNNDLIDSDGKSVNAIIFNERANTFFTYSAGKNGSKFTPSLNELRDNGEIENDQLSSLQKIATSGHRYSSAVKNHSWKAGQTPGSKISDALDSLLFDLSAPDMPPEPENKWTKAWANVSQDVLDRGREISKGMKELANDPEWLKKEDELVKQYLARKKADREKTGVGRDKR